MGNFSNYREILNLFDYKIFESGNISTYGHESKCLSLFMMNRISDISYIERDWNKEEILNNFAKNHMVRHISPNHYKILRVLE